MQPMLSGDVPPPAFGTLDAAVGRTDLHEHVTLYSSDERYLWLNTLPVLGEGAVDLRAAGAVTGRIRRASFQDQHRRSIPPADPSQMTLAPLRAWPGLLALGCVLLTGPLQGQTRPFLGASGGIGSVPVALQDPCTAPSTHATAEARAGLERGAFALEARGVLQGAVSRVMCVMAPRVREDGVHAERIYPFSRGDIGAADLRLRYGPRTAAPLVLHGGAGWLLSHDLPYVVAGAGLRNGGRVRLALDVERTEYRIPFDQVWREWRDYRMVREVRREAHREWEGGWSLRAGVEVRLSR